MKNKRNAVLANLVAVIFILLTSPVQVQPITGFWEVKEVTVGDEIMTPVAKWTKINKDGTFQSGNGWLQNSEGTWKYDKRNNTFLPEETNGIVDEFGAFTVSFAHDKMIWQRKEEGMDVIVTLEKITELPKSTADRLVGLWDMIKIEKQGNPITDSFDPDNQHYLFIRWDRIYVERTPEGERATGYWHINGHRPELTLLSHNKDKEAESWRVSVTDSTRMMTGMSDTNKDLEVVYQRIQEFPR